MADLKAVKDVWKQVPPSDLPEIGSIILQRLFEQHPETQAFFSHFKDVPLEQLRNNAELRRQGQTVLEALGVILKEDINGPRLKALANSHVNVHKIPVQNFTLATDIAVKVLTERFPSQMTAQVQESFLKVFATMCSALKDLYVTEKK